MGRKKKRVVETVKPWCFFCDRVFEDESVLIQHQKARHFKCTSCSRKLNSVGGLRIHLFQVREVGRAYGWRG